MFTPFTLNGQTVKNRIVRSATRDYLFNADGTVTDEFVAIYEELAKNDVGLIICGCLRNDDRYTGDEPSGSVDGEKYIPGLTRIAQAVHKYNSLIYGQMIYTGPVDFDNLTAEKMDEISLQYVKGAATLQQAGYDGVQVHMAHGNMLSQLMQFDLESRSDEMRLELPMKIVREIKKACGTSFTVISKMNANVGGIDRLIHYVDELHKAGLDAVELSGTDWTQTDRLASLYYLDAAKAVKKKIGLPVILVGGINSTEAFCKALDEGIDLIGMCRAFIREPDFAVRLKEGNAVSKCVHCNQCLSIGKTKYKRCVFGPEIPFLRDTFQTI